MTDVLSHRLYQDSLLNNYQKILYGMFIYTLYGIYIYFNLAAEIITSEMSSIPCQETKEKENRTISHPADIPSL